MASQCCATGAVLVPGAGSYANLALGNGYAFQAFGRCAISSNPPTSPPTSPRPSPEENRRPRPVSLSRVKHLESLFSLLISAWRLGAQGAPLPLERSAEHSHFRPLHGKVRTLPMSAVLAFKSRRRNSPTVVNGQVLPPRRIANLERRSREHLTPAEVERLIKAAGKVRTARHA